MTSLPSSARVVIIGGGISGCSLAYHLAQLGWRDVVLLEATQLTSGTTRHATGLVGQLHASRAITRLAKYSADLYARLGAKTGLATGFRASGSITLALTGERREELLRQAGSARAFGVEVGELSLTDIKAMYPHLNTEGVAMGVHLPSDGYADPGTIALALAKGAHVGGVLIGEGVKVVAVTKADGRVTGVDWVQGEARGHIAADMVVNCAGIWGRDLAAASGVALPLQAREHRYIVTDTMPDLGQLPVLRVPDESAYYKQDGGKILLGGYAPWAKPWGRTRLPDSLRFDRLPEDFAHFEPVLATAVNRMPMLAKAEIKTFFNGPESFTPDGRFYLGEAAELGGYWVAAGYNLLGITAAGGAGMALAEWMDSGEPPFDLWDIDIRRAQNFQKNRQYLHARTSETQGLPYANQFPYHQPTTAHGISRSAVHEQLKAAGAVFGETAGWACANWFADPGQAGEYRDSWARQNWFENSAAEHRALREGVGLIDMSSFGKIRVEGPGAPEFMQRVMAGQIDVDVGRIVYCQMLNARAGIECDLTVTRLGETAFLLVVPAATLQRDLAWLRRHLRDDLATITDVTAAEAVLCLMGPRSRALLSACSPADFSNAAHAFGTAREIEVGMGLARAHRISSVGELGWELYVSTDQAASVYEALIEAGAAEGLRLCGLHAMNSCRMEKARRSFGHDIGGADHVLEAGLGFAVDLGKGDFIGREAVLRKREAGLTRRLVQFLLSDPAPMLYQNEPILRDGRVIGVLSSGVYGHTLAASVGLGHVPCATPGESAADMLGGRYEIEVAGQRFDARASLAPFYDPKSRRPRT